MNEAEQNLDRAQEVAEKFGQEAAMSNALMAIEHDFILEALGTLAQALDTQEIMGTLLGHFLQITREREAAALATAREALGDEAEKLRERQEALLAFSERRIRAAFGLVDSEGSPDETGEPGS